MPEAGATEEGGLPIEAVFAQIAGKVVKNLLRCCRLVFIDSCEGIFSAFTSVDEVKAVQVAVDGAEHAHHVPKTSPGYLHKIKHRLLFVFKS